MGSIQSESEPKISNEELYKLIWKEHCFAVDLRDRILRGWCYVYVALAGGYIWTAKESQPHLVGLIAIAGVLTTIFFWLFDYRNRDGIGAAKRIAMKLEEDLGIKPKGFFNEAAGRNAAEGGTASLLRSIRHGHVIDATAVIALFFFGGWAFRIYFC